MILDGRHGVIKLELKGPDNSLRIRQVRILGESGDSLVIPQRSATTIQQRLCESETLKVFRLITSQVNLFIINPSKNFYQHFIVVNQIYIRNSFLFRFLVN